MEVSKSGSTDTKKKDQLFLFDKKSLAEPLNDHGKYIRHMADSVREPGKL